MVSLSRYALRIGITIALITTMFSIFATIITVNTVQDNLNAIQTQRADYLAIDDNINQRLTNVSVLFNTVMNEQLDLYLRNILEQNNDVSDDINRIKLESAAGNLTTLLEERQESNYEIKDVLNGPSNLYLMFQEMPETDGIMDTGFEGIYTAMFQFSRSTLQLALTIAEEGDTERAELNENRDLLDDGIEVSEETFHNFDMSFHHFNHRMFANNSLIALEILRTNRYIHPNITLIIDGFSHLLYQLSDTPTEIHTDEYAELINETRSNIVSINETIFAVGLSAEDAVSYNNIINNATLYFDAMEANLEYVRLIVDKYEDIAVLVRVSVRQVTSIFSSTIQTVLNILNQESNTFETVTGDFLLNLRNVVNTVTFTLFGSLSVLSGIVFLWIFITLTRNMGRILDKNLRLSDGDLTIKSRNKYGRNEIGLIERSIDTFALQMRSIITSMKHSSETLAGISEELAAGAEEASASITDVSQTVREFSSGSSEQNLMLNRVRNELIQHLNVVEQTANSIDETAKFVLRVAKRTNILGLNASIEAAKAGRFGLGFNVVAEEVRSLSDETRNSANQIATSIEAIEFNIRQTVQDILDEVNIIKEVAENTAVGSEDASLATSEQVHMMNEVSQTSAQLSELSHSLNQMMQNFKVQ